MVLDEATIMAVMVERPTGQHVRAGGAEVLREPPTHHRQGLVPEPARAPVRLVESA